MLQRRGIRRRGRVGLPKQTRPTCPNLQGHHRCTVGCHLYSDRLDCRTEYDWGISNAPNRYNGICDPVHKNAMAISDINLRKFICGTLVSTEFPHERPRQFIPGAHDRDLHRRHMFLGHPFHNNSGSLGRVKPSSQPQHGPPWCHHSPCHCRGTGSLRRWGRPVRAYALRRPYCRCEKCSSFAAQEGTGIRKHRTTQVQI